MSMDSYQLRQHRPAVVLIRCSSVTRWSPTYGTVDDSGLTPVCCCVTADFVVFLRCRQRPLPWRRCGDDGWLMRPFINQPSINQKLTTFFIIFKWCRTKHRWVVYSVVSALHGRTMTNKHRPLHLRCENITIIRPSCSWTQYLPIPFWTEASVWLAFTSPSSYTSTRIGTLYLDTSVLIKHRGEMGFTCCQK